MAQKVTVMMVDDLDGTPGEDVQPVDFGLDGVVYQIDLNSSNAARMRDVLAEFVASARRTGGRVKRGLGAGPAPRPAVSAGLELVQSSPSDGRPVVSGREQTAAIREWARNQGYDVADRGRVPAGILEAFEQAHQGARKRR